MARRSKTGLEVGGGRLPPGAIAKPPALGGREPPLQVLARPPRPKCPHCGSENVREGSGPRGRVRYFHCRRCADPETGDWTRFRVLREESSPRPASQGQPAPRA